MTRYYTICFNITYGDLISCSSGPLDGQNRLKIYWKDLIDSASCQLNDLAFAGKLYLQFEQQDDGFGNRIFEKANAGLVFESFQMVIVASNAAYCGNVVFLPMYCKVLFDVLF